MTRMEPIPESYPLQALDCAAEFPLSTDYTSFHQHLRAKLIPRWLKRWIKRRTNHMKAWKGGIAINICIALAVLLVNISLLAWALSAYGINGGILWKGSCDKVEGFALAGHAIINISGTLLLAASNYAMQVLVAPSRQDVNLAHSRKMSFSIGTQSFNNFRSITSYRAMLWILFALSSIPLHLLYNSVIFSVTSINDYAVVVASSSFAEGGTFDLTLRKDDSSASQPVWDSLNTHALSKRRKITPDDRSLIEDLQQKARGKQLTRLGPAECVEAYDVTSQTNYRNLVALSDQLRSESSVWIDYLFRESANPADWICKYNTTEDTGDPDWFGTCQSNLTHSETGLAVGRHRISSCLVEESSCTLRYNLWILVTVIVANLTKVLAMIATLRQYRRPALVTIGDALASFLEKPDATTVGMCLAATRDDRCSDLWESDARLYLPDTETQSSFGASYVQWMLTFALMGVNIGVACIPIAMAYIGHDDSWKWSFSSAVEYSSIKAGKELSIPALIVIGNIPQLFLSFYYISFNRLITCMAIGREWSLLAYQRKGLRTSRAKQSQRSTYWLQLPFKFSIPLITASAGLHYLASQSFLFGFVRLVPYNDSDGGPIVKGLGYSRIPALILIWLLIISMMAAIRLGWMPNKPGLPVGGCNSAVLSAACHPPAGEEDVHFKSVQWGEVAWDGPFWIGHCSFSSEEVTMPSPGKKYW